MELDEVLAEFLDRALFVTGTRDEIIPHAVVRLYERALSRCRKFEKFLVSGRPHPVSRRASTASKTGMQAAV